MKWETMTFNVFEMGTEESVQRAFDVLRDGGAVVEAIHELPWSKCCVTGIINGYLHKILLESPIDLSLCAC